MTSQVNTFFHFPSGHPNMFAHLAMKLLFLVTLISLVASVPEPHLKKIDANGNLHVHLNLADLNKPKQAWETENTIRSQNRPGNSIRGEYGHDYADKVDGEDNTYPHDDNKGQDNNRDDDLVDLEKPNDKSKDVCACGQPHRDKNRISGGRIATPHQYPWIVRLITGCSSSSNRKFGTYG